MFRFNIGSLLIVTTFVAGLIAAAKYSSEAVGTYVVLVCISLLLVGAMFDENRNRKANIEREKREREEG